MTPTVRHRPPPGSRPGTIVLSPDASPPRIRMMRFTLEELDEREVVEPRELAAELENGGILWVDVQGLGDEGVLRTLAEVFSIHPLALEDVVNVPQRPKTEGYDASRLFITRMLRFEANKLSREQVTFFLGRTWVLSFQERYGDILDPVRARLRKGNKPIRSSGADYLLYTLLDAIIDGYFPALEYYGEELERLEAKVMDAPVTADLARINVLKRELLGVRRAVWPQRDALSTAIRDETSYLSDPVKVYLRDCYDHCVQVGDVVESYREIASGLLNTYLSSVANRTNDVMKVLTIMASLFIPLTFLAGIYGMNFTNMPELDEPWAYPALLSVMAVVGVGMVAYFVRKGWIGQG